MGGSCFSDEEASFLSGGASVLMGQFSKKNCWMGRVGWGWVFPLWETLASSVNAELIERFEPTNSRGGCS